MKNLKSIGHIVLQNMSLKPSTPFCTEFAKGNLRFNLER